MGKILNRGGTLVLASILLGGCGLPVGVTIASWAADGISYVATDKTLTEHGISAAVGQDCSVWRTLKGGELCIEQIEDTEPIAVAENDDSQVDEFDYELDTEDVAYIDYIHLLPKAVENKQNNSISTEIAENKISKEAQVADDIVSIREEKLFEQTVLATNEKNDAPTTKPLLVHYAKPLEAESVVASQSEGPLTIAKVDAAVNLAQKIESKPKEIGNKIIPEKSADRYFVIGSYLGPSYANRHAGRHALLGASVAKAKVGRKEVYRVLVGPFTRAEQPAIRKIIKRSNIDKAWVISMNAPDHTGGAQLASLLEAYQNERRFVQVANNPR
jgi:cell division protein FtsN